MKTIKMKIGFSSSLMFLIFILLLIISCKEATQVNETPVEPAKSVQTMPDTTGIEQDTISVPSIEKLELGKAEVETRLDALLSLIEQKEKSLLERETRLLEQEKILAKRQVSLKLQQIISWIVLALGVLGIVFGFIIGRKKQKKSASKTKTEVKSKAVAEGEAAEKKHIIETEEVNAESKVEEKEPPKEKPQSKPQNKK